jgi:hypothetical protein
MTEEQSVIEAQPVSEPVLNNRISEIAQAAYYKAERRGFIPGYEIEDWLEAELEVEKATVGLDGA